MVQRIRKHYHKTLGTKTFGFDSFEINCVQPFQPIYFYRKILAVQYGLEPINIRWIKIGSQSY